MHPAFSAAIHAAEERSGVFILQQSHSADRSRRSELHDAEMSVRAPNLGSAERGSPRFFRFSSDFFRLAVLVFGNAILATKRLQNNSLKQLFL